VLLNHASSGLEPKNLIGIPWRVAFALQADGWWLRSDIIWNKPNVLPESVLDRPTGAHEYIFLMAKSDRYYYDSTAIREPDSGQEHKHTIVNGAPSLEPSGGIKPVHKGLWGTGERNGAGRNKRSVWTVPTQPFAGAHFATFPRDLVLPCVLAGCPEGGVVLDPFAGAGTTALVAKENGRHWIGIELKADYIALAEQRTSQEVLFGAPE
jgi:DNA modification methylase